MVDQFYWTTKLSCTCNNRMYICLSMAVCMSCSHGAHTVCWVLSTSWYDFLWQMRLVFVTWNMNPCLATPSVFQAQVVVKMYACTHTTIIDHVSTSFDHLHSSHNQIRTNSTSHPLVAHWMSMFLYQHYIIGSCKNSEPVSLYDISKKE